MTPRRWKVGASTGSRPAPSARRASGPRDIDSIDLLPLYGPSTEDAAARIGMPGEPPYTRGIHPSGYRSRLWTMRMFAGFGAAEDTNARFKDLLAAGQTGLSIAYDMPTLYGYDSDDEEAEGEFGTCGVGVSIACRHGGLARRPAARPRLDLDDDQSPRRPDLGVYIVAAEKAGYPRAMLEGHDPERHPQGVLDQKSSCSRRAVDAPRYRHDRVGTNEMPRWNTVSISGYHIREAGSTAVQELRSRSPTGCLRRAASSAGCASTTRAPVLLSSTQPSDFFEEIAKFRASRRIWTPLDARSATTPRTSARPGCGSTPRPPASRLRRSSPLNNLTRVAIQAWPRSGRDAVTAHGRLRRGARRPHRRGGAPGPSQQQVIAEETGVTGTVRSRSVARGSSSS